MKTDITVFFIRHPSYQKLYHSVDRFLQVSSKTVTLSFNAHREITEAMWLFTKSEMNAGINDFEQLRTFDGIYSTPSIRGVLGCLALIPNIRMNQCIHAYKTLAERRKEKRTYYLSLNWNKEDESLIPQIIEAELELEFIGLGNNIIVKDAFYDLLDIPPRWTGANSKLFHLTMNATKFSPHHIRQITKTLQGILLANTNGKNPKRYICMLHGSTLVFLKKYGKYILHGNIPKSATAHTYGQIKYDGIPLEKLSYHGCGIIFRFKKDGTFISQEEISIKEIMETGQYQWQKRMLFNDPQFLPMK